MQYILKAVSKLTSKDIDKVITDLSNNTSNQVILKHSIINPIFGYLFEATGTLSNIRFYGNGLKTFKEANLRNYSKDSSNDSHVNFIIELFPSPSGVLCSIRNMKDNFGYVFKHNQKEGIEFLSEMFVRILESDKVSNCCENNEKHAFSKIRKILFNTNNRIEKMFNEVDECHVKLMTIHSFILNSLDDKNDLKYYLNKILEKIHYPSNIGIYQFKFDLMKEVIAMDTFNLYFPYSEFNPPSPNGITPIYDRKTDQFDSNTTFSDCAEILVLHICNCLLYDSENLRYSTKELDPNSDIFKFYQKYNRIFSLNDEVRKDWSRVIQGHDNFSNSDEGKYKLNSILYLNSNRNELDTGIINMMNILIKIFNINHEIFWNDFNNRPHIEYKLQKLFEIITPCFSKRIISIEMIDPSFKEIETGSRTEFYGSFNLVVTLPNDSIFKFQVIQTTRHACMKINCFSRKENLKRIDSLQLINFESLPAVIFKTFIEMPWRNICHLRRFTIFDRIYFYGPLETNERKYALLLEILELIVSRESIKTDDTYKKLIEALKETTHVILSSVRLNELRTRLQFKPALVYIDDLEDEDVIECWLKSLTIPTMNIYKLWEGRVQTLKNDCLKLKFSGIPIYRVKFIFNLLSKLPNLKILKISIEDIRITKIISKELPKCRQLTHLDISNNNLKSHEMWYIAEALKYLTNLTDINISQNNLQPEGMYYLSNAFKHLNNLTCLNLSQNSMDWTSIHFLAGEIKKLKKLEILDLSANKICTGALVVLLSEIVFLKNLAFLDLSKNSLCEKSEIYFSFAFRFFKHLKFLNLNDNYIQPPVLENISRAWKEIQISRHSNIPNNCQGNAIIN